VLWGLVLLALASAGCEQTGYLLYLFAPGTPAKTVEAEFSGLENHRVAVVVYADPRVQYEYPFVRLTVATAVGSELRKGLKGVGLVEPAKVIKYQDQDTSWESMGKTELGKALGADHVLLISLVEYATREPGSMDLLRGRIIAQCSLYQTDLPERDSGVWRGKDISIIYPQGGPVGAGQDDTAIRVATERLFAEELARKFYKHKAPPKEQ
jgi:hypothetical protein